MSGVCGGVTSRDSSNTGAKSSSSEMMKEVDSEALRPMLELRLSEEPCGHDG